MKKRLYLNYMQVYIDWTKFLLKRIMQRIRRFSILKTIYSNELTMYMLLKIRLPDLYECTGSKYYRSHVVIDWLKQKLSNSFIKNASELSGDDVFIAEARFLRAYAYYNLLDLYGNVPLTTEISTELPTQSNELSYSIS